MDIILTDYTTCRAIIWKKRKDLDFSCMGFKVGMQNYCAHSMMCALCYIGASFWELDFG